MGLAVARAAAARGAVTVVLGPVDGAIEPRFRRPGIDVIPVESAREMARAVLPRFRRCDIAIHVAAVADFRPAARVRGKIKKGTVLAGGRARYVVELVENPDILWSCGQVKRERQVLAGFALESADAERHGRAKLLAKNLDFVVCNAPSTLNAARADVIVLTRDGGRHRIRGSKAAIGRRLVSLALELWHRRSQAKPTQLRKA